MERETWSSMRSKYEERRLDVPVLQKLIEKMELDPVQAILGKSLLHPSYSDFQVSRLNKTETSAPHPSFIVTEAAELHSSFRMRYRCSTDGFLNVSYSHFPFNRVEIDGKVVPVYKSVTNLVVVSTPKGEHTLMIQADLSKLRMRLIFMGGATCLIILTFVTARAFRH